MNLSKPARLYRWDEIPRERLNSKLYRKMITGDRMMLTRIDLKKGCVVPLHQHENEQLTYVVEGALKFWLGSEDGEEITVRGGEVLHLPSNLPHKALALEDTIDIDIFSPPRQDWLDKTDDYLRNEEDSSGKE